MLLLYSLVLFLLYDNVHSELRQVIALARHGVRGPFGPVGKTMSAENFESYSTNGYKFLLKGTDWGTSDNPNDYVVPNITRHGVKVISKIGKYFRDNEYGSLFGDREQLTAEDCQRITAYADDSERDKVTAVTFFNAFAPECESIQIANDGAEALFQQGQTPTKTCPLCTREEFSGIIGSNTTDALVKLYTQQISAVNDILQCCQPVICGPQFNSNDQCTFHKVPCTWKGLFYSPFQDPISEADYFAEFFLLQALNNMPLPNEKLTLEDVVSLSSLHLAHLQLTTNEYSVANFGSTLLAHITAAMEQTVSGKRLPLDEGEGPPLVHGVDNRFIYYAGHDINLLFIRKFLRMEWMTKSWLPNQPAVGGMILFELHYLSDNSLWDPKSNYFVRAYYEGATPTQIRNAETLSSENRPERVEVAIPRCTESINGKLLCPFSTFKSLVANVLESRCASKNMQNFIRSLKASHVERSLGPSLLGMLIFAIVFALGLGMIIPKCLRNFRRQPKEDDGMYRAEYVIIKPE